MTQKHVLFVDDDASVLAALRRSLRKSPYQVSFASSGCEGLKLMDQTAFAAVVSDQRMPGMLGIEFLKHVHQSYPETVRILMSGNADPGEVRAAMQQGDVDHYLEKPWSPDQLNILLIASLEG